MPTINADFDEELEGDDGFSPIPEGFGLEGEGDADGEFGGESDMDDLEGDSDDNY